MAAPAEGIDSEIEALTEFAPPAVPSPQVPSTGSVVMPRGAEETADLRDDPAITGPGTRARHKRWAWLAGAALILLAAAASTYLRDAPVEAVAPPVPPRPGSARP